MSRLLTLIVISLGVRCVSAVQPNEAQGTSRCNELRSACLNGVSISCVELSRALLGIGHRCDGGIDVDQAETLLESACHEGLPEACMLLGTLYADEYYGLVNQSSSSAAYARGAAILKDACDLEHPRACAEFSRVIDAGRVPAQPGDSTRYFELAARGYRRACDADDIAACVSLAELFWHVSADSRQSERNDIEIHLTALEQACKLGAYVSCDKAGMILRDGHSPVAVDIPRALDLFHRACEQGFYPSCIASGMLHEARDDSILALTSFEKACVAGDCEGCERAAGFYDAGRGVPEDARRARELRATDCVDRRRLKER